MLVILFLWNVLDKKNRDVILGSSAGKESTCNAGDPGLLLGSGRSSGEGIGYPLQYSWACLVAQMVRNPPAMQETWVLSLFWWDPLEEGMATHSIINPQTEGSGRLWSMGSQRVGHDWATKHSTQRPETDKEWYSRKCSSWLLCKIEGFLGVGASSVKCTIKDPTRVNHVLQAGLVVCYSMVKKHGNLVL